MATYKKLNQHEVILMRLFLFGWFNLTEKIIILQLTV